MVRVTGLALAFAIGVFLFQASARASCGDYLTHPSASVQPGAHVADASHILPDSSKSRQPCSGPNCSQRSEPLPFVPIAPSSPHSDQWGCFPLIHEVPAPDVGLLAGVNTPVHAIHRCFPLERPPR